MEQEDSIKKEFKKIHVMEINKNVPAPIITNGIMIGWNKEIFGEDSVEYNFKLPLGAIRRLIHSYFRDIYECRYGWIFLQTVGSSDMRRDIYAWRMLDHIEKELINNNLPGEEIIDDIFSRYFKKDFEMLKEIPIEDIENAIKEDEEKLDSNNKAGTK